MFYYILIGFLTTILIVPYINVWDDKLPFKSRFFADPDNMESKMTYIMFLPILFILFWPLFIFYIVKNRYDKNRKLASSHSGDKAN
jgi:hypothetical protein